MNCEFCQYFCESKWRINPDAEDDKKSKKKPVVQSRHCSHINKYVSGKKEICEDGFKPHHLFWCERNNCRQFVEACIARASKSEECYGCPQYKTIVDVQKARHFLKRRMARELEESSKPKLIRRTP